MTYPMTDEDRAIQAKARAFVADELIPYEVEAELNDGELPAGGGRPPTGEAAGPRLQGHQHCRRSSAATGTRPSSRRWSRSRPGGSRTPSAGSCTRRPRRGCRRGHPVPDGAVGDAHHPRRATRVLRDHRGERRVGRRRDPGHGPAQRRRVRAQRREVARHLVNQAEYVFFQAKLTDGPHAGEHAMFIVDLDTPGVRVRANPGVLAHVGHHHWIVALRRRPGPDRQPGRRGGRRHGVRLRVVPVRAADDRGAVLRGGRAADRGGHGVR